MALVVSLVAVLGLIESRPASAQGDSERLLTAREAPAGAETAASEPPPPPAQASARPAPLVGLYTSFAALQALDIAGTHSAIKAGGVEGNPLVAQLVESPLAFTLAKAGVAGALIYLSERLWKRNRLAAVLTMVGLNVGYGVVVTHNYRLAAGQRR